MIDRYCKCGCGKKLTRKKGEPPSDFLRRNYDTRDCYENSRKGAALKPRNFSEIKFHPVLDKFLYGRME